MLKPDFKDIQLAFAAHIRGIDSNQMSGLCLKRLNLYRQLFFNNIESFIAGGFPVLKTILDQDAWHDLIADFYARHKSQTPYFAFIAQEFLSYLQNEREFHAADPCFMQELAHYEWLELDLAISEGWVPAAFSTNDWQGLQIELSSLVRLMEYRFPVHRLSKAYQPESPPLETTFLAVYRNRQDEVRFLELNKASFRLLKIIEEQQQDVSSMLQQLALELNHTDSSMVFNFGLELLQGLSERGLIGLRRFEDRL